MDINFKVPSVIPQDLLLIQDLIGSLPPPTVPSKHVPDSPSDDSIASTDDEVESEAEVEADLVPRDEDNGISVATSDPILHSVSESDASTSSDSEEGDYEAPLMQQRSVDDVEDEESEVTTAATYLQTKNEVVDANIPIPTVSEVEPCDTLEKVGEIMSIVGNIVIVRGLPVDHVRSLSEHALDAESLLVFEDRKVLGYVYETFGPTSQPLYQVKFNQQYPLDTNKVWLSREVFHVPQRSHFVFVDQLKTLHGSDASNIHDEEPADDEIEFSDDEKEAAFRAQRKRRRGHSVSSSRLSTPSPSTTHVDDIQDAYHSSNPYDAHGPYDDDYYVTGPSRPSPTPYDDPYADVPASDEVRVPATEMNSGFGGKPNWESYRDGPRASHGHMFSRGTRGSGARNRHTPRRGSRNNSIASRRTFEGTDQSFLVTSRMAESATGYGQVGDAIAPHPFLHPPSNSWLSQETNFMANYQQPQPFIQPHINPRFASAFGLNLPSGSTFPWNAHDHTSTPQHWDGTFSVHGNGGSEGDGDTYRRL